MLLHVVTRYTNEEEESLLKCYNSIKQLARDAYDVEWFLVGKGVTWLLEDMPGVRRIESAVRPQNDYGLLLNLYLDCIPDQGQWIYFLDGDNLIHPKLPDLLSIVRKDAVMVNFSQEWAPGKVRHARPENLAVQRVDIAQVLLRRSYIGGLRAWTCYRNDGYLIQELTIRAREDEKDVQIIGEVASYHNKQTW